MTTLFEAVAAANFRVLGPAVFGPGAGVIGLAAPGSPLRERCALVNQYSSKFVLDLFRAHLIFGGSSPPPGFSYYRAASHCAE